MNKLSLISVALSFPLFAFAAQADTKAVLSENEPTQLVEGTNFNWYAVATNDTKGINKIREFHDMGPSGVQQIDYVVNCSNNTMAMADFAVLTPQGRMPANISSATVDMLSFYKPVIHHDLKIANSVCGKQLAMLKTNAMP